MDDALLLLASMSAQKKLCLFVSIFFTFYSSFFGALCLHYHVVCVRTHALRRSHSCVFVLLCN